MPKDNQKENNLLSSALKNNLKLRKQQILSRKKNNIAGKRTTKIGVSSLIDKSTNGKIR
tara:strand:- start:738 stop:914 length:177 start_codon:yes stop_codon:yes gene_type:complete